MTHQQRPVRVLMVTGAYHPEVSGGGGQCRTLVRALQAQVASTVLSVSMDASLPAAEEVDSIPVYRVLVNVNRLGSKLLASLRITERFLRLSRRVDVVHLHGFSHKAILLILLARLCRKPVVLTLHTAGHDEPAAVRAQGRLAFWCYRQADRCVGVSARLEQAYRAAGLPAETFRTIPNGVDLERFRPAEIAERCVLRQELGLPVERPLILFVGFFSRDKRPDTLFEAWLRLQDDGWPTAALVFVGATRSAYFEIDPSLAVEIRNRARRLGAGHRVVFVERSHEIEKYYRAADIFVLPSQREGMPVALLEAMASGLPCIASRLPQVTDVMIEDGMQGLLVPPGDTAALAEALRWMLTQPAQAQALGRQARLQVEAHYAAPRMAQAYLAVYDDVMGDSSHGRPEASRDCLAVRGLKTCLAGGLVFTGLAAAARRAQKGGLRILMYHGIVPRLEGPAAFGDLFMDAAAFERQMRHARRAFDVLSLEEAAALAQRGAPWPVRALAVTIDDGYRHTVTVAQQILQAAGVPATVFLSTDHVSQQRPHWFDVLRVAVWTCAAERRRVSLGGGLVIGGSTPASAADQFRRLAHAVLALPPPSATEAVETLRSLGDALGIAQRYPEFAIAGWAEWRAAVAEGRLTVGSHGQSHEDLTAMPPERCAAVLAASKSRIEQELGRPCLAVAYPYGRWDQRVAAAARSAGYACGVTTDPGLNHQQDSDPFAWRRTMIGDQGDFHLFAARASGAWERLRPAKGVWNE